MTNDFIKLAKRDSKLKIVPNETFLRPRTVVQKKKQTTEI